MTDMNSIHEAENKRQAAQIAEINERMEPMIKAQEQKINMEKFKILQDAIRAGADDASLATLSRELEQDNRGRIKAILEGIVSEDGLTGVDIDLDSPSEPEPVVEETTDEYSGMDYREVTAVDAPYDIRRARLDEAWAASRNTALLLEEADEDARQAKLDKVLTEDRASYQEEMANATTAKERDQILQKRWQALREAMTNG